MAQIQSPETYADGQQVTAARLNNQTNGATLLPGAIIDQTLLPPLTVASDDSVLLHDVSTSTLRKTTVNDLLNSGLPVTAPTATIDTLTVDQVNGKTNKDIDLNPNNGVTETGKTFNSADGITANVTAVAHGLKTGMHLNVTASNPAYTGKQVITVTSPDGFSFTINQTTPVAASGTLSYTADATSKAYGNLFVSEQATVGTDLRVIGNSAVQGNSRVDGTLNVTGLANFTGGISVSGGNFLVLYAVTEETIPYYFAPVGSVLQTVLAYTGSLFDKPSNEFWYFEVDGYLAYGAGSGASTVGIVLNFTNNATTTNYRTVVGQASVAQNNVDLHFHTSWIIPTGTALTSERIKIMFYHNIATGGGAQIGFGQLQTIVEANQTHALTPTRIRIFKYKPL
jgi:hypothetical protein